MKQSIRSLIESVTNPAGRFTALAGVAPILDNDEPIFHVGSRTIDFSVCYKGRASILKFPYGLNQIEKEDLISVADFVSDPDAKYTADCCYYQQETVVFDENGDHTLCDVILQSIPPGYLLHDYAAYCLRRGDRENLRRIALGINEMMIWLESQKYSPGAIGCEDIMVGSDCQSVIFNHTRGRFGKPYESVKSLVDIICGLYLASVDLDYGLKMFSTRNSTALLTGIVSDTYENIDQKDHPALWDLMDAAQHIVDGSIHELYEAVKALPSAKVYARNSVVAVIPGSPTSHNAENSEPAAANETLQNLPCSNGSIRSYDGKKWSYRDNKGRPVNNEKFIFAGDFCNGIAIVENEKGFGVMSDNGEMIFDCTFDDIDYDKEYGLLILTRDGKSGIYNIPGRSGTELVYDRILPPNEGMIAVCIDGKWGYLSADGSPVIDLRYDDAASFYDGMAEVRLNGKVLKIDKTGNVVG